MRLTILILALVTLQRLLELWLSNRNTSALIKRGAREEGRGHYPLIVALHLLWGAVLWWLAPGRPVNGPWLGAFIVLQLMRVWVIATLGRRWTTRIIVLPGEPLVKRGPYRWVNHPNYIVVTGEMAVLPLVWGLWPIALIFSILNALVLFIRIRAENRALGHGQD